MVFHFNKGHLADPSVPMWVLKTQGESYYVHHVDCNIAWSTKETPDNHSTKGSIKIRNALLRIDSDNCATLTALTDADRKRLRREPEKPTRIITKSDHSSQLRDSLKNLDIRHGPIKSMGSACTDTFYITDIYREQDLTALLLAMAGTSMRILMPNEYYYGIYDDPKYQGVSDIDLDADSYDDDDEE